MSLFFGKYRGRVENNIDPQMQDRLQVSAPAVLGWDTMRWEGSSLVSARAADRVGLTAPVRLFIGVQPRCRASVLGVISG